MPTSIDWAWTPRSPPRCSSRSRSATGWISRPRPCSRTPPSTRSRPPCTRTSRRTRTVVATSVGSDRATDAIRHHYDIGNAFFSLWLDSSLTYSCALRESPGDTLEIAQERKLQFHLDAIRADRARAVLD